MKRQASIKHSIKKIHMYLPYFMFTGNDMQLLRYTVNELTVQTFFYSLQLTFHWNLLLKAFYTIVKRRKKSLKQ